AFFSLPISWAFFGSFQIDGSSISWLTCSSFSDFLSKSKIPPKFGLTTGQVVQQGGNGVDAFGFHGLGSLISGLNRTADYTRRRRSDCHGRGHCRIIGPVLFPGFPMNRFLHYQIGMAFAPLLLILPVHAAQAPSGATAVLAV